VARIFLLHFAELKRAIQFRAEIKYSGKISWTKVALGVPQFEV
jgi:hypothetical protein